MYELCQPVDRFLEVSQPVPGRGHVVAPLMLASCMSFTNQPCITEMDGKVDFESCRCMAVRTSGSGYLLTRANPRRHPAVRHSNYMECTTVATLTQGYSVCSNSPERAPLARSSTTPGDFHTTDYPNVYGRGLQYMKMSSSRLHGYVRNLSLFWPLGASYFAIVFGWMILLIIAPRLVEIDSPRDIEVGLVLPKEALARHKVGISFVLFVSISIAAGVFAASRAWLGTRAMHRGRLATMWILFTFVTCGTLEYADFLFGLNRHYTFLDIFGKTSTGSENVFQATIGRHFEPIHPYPAFLGNILEIVSTFNSLAYYFAILTVTIICCATCTLVPYKAYVVLRKPALQKRLHLDAAARQIETQFRLLRHYLFATAIVLFVALVYMNASRHWPVAFFDSNDNRAAEMVAGIARGTVFFQAGHFVLVIVAAFVPIALRLKSAAERISQCGVRNRDWQRRKLWLSERGLVSTKVDIFQQAFAVSSPFIVPVVDLVARFVAG